MVKNIEKIADKPIRIMVAVLQNLKIIKDSNGLACAFNTSIHDPKKLPSDDFDVNQNNISLLLSPIPALSSNKLHNGIIYICECYQMPVDLLTNNN